MHVLFISEKWCDANPACGKTNSEHNLWGSLDATGLATYDCFFYDEYYRSRNQRIDPITLRNLVVSKKPDLIIMTYLIRSHTNIEFPTLSFLYQSGIPIIFIWFDFVNHEVCKMAKILSNFTVATVVLDVAEHSVFANPKFIPMWTPQDPRIFNNPNIERDIDISFAGSVLSYTDRLAALTLMKKSGIPVYQNGGQRECKLTVQEYAKIHQRSKMSINFCKSVEGYVQIKGRVFEALLCGSMLLESRNKHTDKYLIPMKDYVPFDNEVDLVEKARYYLEHENERLEIAKNGCEKATNQYNAKNFWLKLFAKVCLTK